MKSLRSFFAFLGVFTAHMATATDPPSCPPLPPLDITTDNIITARVIPFLIVVVYRDVSPRGGDATLVLRSPAFATNSWFDAGAPYHKSAVGVWSRIPRRPMRERTTENINTAVMYATYQVLDNVLPGNTDYWKLMLKCSGLDPSKVDDVDDLSSPVDIGNVAGKAVAIGRQNDGMNQLGNEGGYKFNQMPYSDYTDYQPVNTAYELKKPNRWQPDINRLGLGVYKVQQFVTPQHALVEPFSYEWSRLDEVAKVDRPTASNWKKNRRQYRRQAKHVLDVSAALTDRQKVMAELFDNKLQSLGFPILHESKVKQMSTWEFAVFDYMAHVVSHDAGVWLWKNKREFDAVRPFSAIRMLYENDNVTAWGGPGKGTQTIPGKEWMSYLNSADHPEYPSASACICTAHAQAMRRFLGSDDLGWRVSGPGLPNFGGKGTSIVEPGVTPKEDLPEEDVTFETWSEWEYDCAQSRVWAGAHFQAAVDASVEVCEVFGNLAVDFVESLLDGTAPLHEPSRGIDPTTLY